MSKNFRRCTIEGILLALLFITSASHAFEEIVPRYALVIGNANYSFSPLKNPINDANDMASKLESLRYQVTLATDQNPQQMRTIIEQFYASITEPDAISVFYYAGHAIQADNVNYLIPVNAQISTVELMTERALSFNTLLTQLRGAASQQNIIILDACRNNPFKVAKTTSTGRSLTNLDAKVVALSSGLAPIKAPTGTLIAYATEPGNIALDGRGDNGTYTSALLKYIDSSETAEELFKKVRKAVLRKTKNKQTPWEHSSLIDKFYFMPPSNEEIPDIISF
jgi:uncharacterized caspase-like protein